MGAYVTFKPTATFEDDILGCLSKSTTSTFYPDDCPGRKVVKTIYVAPDKKWKIELFAETTLPMAPPDRFAYETRDCKISSGIIIYKAFSTTKLHDGGIRSFGETVSFDDFINHYVHRNDVRIHLIREMDTLIEQSQLSEKFLDEMNSAWNERGIGSATIIPERVLC